MNVGLVIEASNLQIFLKGLQNCKCYGNQSAENLKEIITEFNDPKLLNLEKKGVIKTEQRSLGILQQLSEVLVIMQIDLIHRKACNE